MKTKKLILFICIIVAAVTVLSGCAHMITDDSGLISSGDNVVVLFDCGKYLKTPFDATKVAQEVVYGEIAKEESDSYVLGFAEKYEKQLRRLYTSENSFLPDDKFIGEGNEPVLSEKLFVNWYVASVVQFKQNEDGTFLLNSLGQRVYDRVIPQESDVLWSTDFRVGTYEDHPLAAIQTLYDNNKAIDAMVEVDGEMVQNLYTPTDEDLAYNEENGFSIFLYAKYVDKPYYVAHWTNLEAEDEFVFRIEATTPSAKLNKNTVSRNAEKDDFTFYGLFLDKELTLPWDYDTTFSTFDVQTNRPYVILYLKYLEGEWSICRTAEELASAVARNQNIYLDNDVTFAGETVWKYCNYFNHEFAGNGYSVIFENKFVINNATITDRVGVYNFGLFSVFAGNMHDVNFVNVTLETERPFRDQAWKNGICVGLLVGRVQEGAEFENVVISGKVTYLDDWDGYQKEIPDSNPTAYYEISNDGGWYGENFSDKTLVGVTYTPTV